MHALKIDTPFVTDMSNADNDAVIVRSTIGLAHNLGLTVVAEGVEYQDTWDLLEILRCDTAQGYFLSRPLPEEKFLAWIKSTSHYQAGTFHRTALQVNHENIQANTEKIMLGDGHPTTPLINLW